MDGFNLLDVNHIIKVINVCLLCCKVMNKNLIRYELLIKQQIRDAIHVYSFGTLHLYTNISLQMYATKCALWCYTVIMHYF